MARPLYPWIDWLIPRRTPPQTLLSSYSLAGGSSVYVDIEVPEGYSHLIVQVEVAYGANAVNGVRVFWLYSMDGKSFDTENGATSIGNYIDPIVVAGATEALTLAIPAYTKYIRLTILNRDSNVAHTVTIRASFARL